MRTLHHYDEIGLLSPEKVSESGYRLYSDDDIDLLQQILFFRELGFPLKEIKEVINRPTFDRQEALKSHRKLLLKKREQIDKMIQTIDKTIRHLKGEIKMTDEEKFEAFKEKLIAENEQKYGKEIRGKYGDETVDTSNAKLRGMSEEDYEAMTQLDTEIRTLLPQAVATGDPASELAQEVAAMHKEWIMYSWTTYSKEAHAGLADMYVADERFTAYYDQSVEGGAKFLRDAIYNYLGMEDKR